jgi:hypothetical protein
MKYLSDPAGRCPVCSTRDVRISPANSGLFDDNFYLAALRSDLGIDESVLKDDMKVFECLECSTIYCDPWLNYETSAHVFNVIYGQHNRGWDALWAWLRNESVQDYSRMVAAVETRLGELLSYAEYNCPFQGNLLHLRSGELGSGERQGLYSASRDYLLSRQQDRFLAANTDLKPDIMRRRSTLALSNLELARENITPSAIQRYLLHEATSLCWSSGCNGEGVNCRSLASVLLGVGTMSIVEAIKQGLKVDLVGVYNTLDHVIDPIATVGNLLKVSRAILIVNHAQEVISKQHHFVLRPGFVEFLRNKGFDVQDISDEASYDSTEINQEKLILLIQA